MFKDLIGKTMEVYVDDMLVKSRIETRSYGPFVRNVFNFKKVSDEAQPLKCSFRVGSGKFLGFMVN